MGQSPFWEIDTHSISQEICRLIRTPKIYYHAHHSLLLDPILYQKNPVHTLISNLFIIHFNIIPPSTSMSRSPNEPHPFNSSN
jgi:hypothetical protein